jgi:hypothetical protein
MILNNLKKKAGKNWLIEFPREPLRIEEAGQTIGVGTSQQKYAESLRQNSSHHKDDDVGR